MGRLSAVKLMEKFGYRHVPDNMVQVIERHGRYHRADGSTYVKPRAFSESFGPQVRVGIRVVENRYQNIASRDGVLHSINVHVKVFFDLRQADAVVAPVLAYNAETFIQNKVRGLVDLALRRHLSHLDSTQLLQPDAAVKLEGAIKSRLERNLGFMGVSLPPFEDALVVKEIMPPERMQETRTEATNITETAISLARLTAEKIEQAIVAHFYRDVGKRPIQVRSMNLPDSLNPLSETQSDSSFRVLQQPTGRIYDN